MREDLDDGLVVETRGAQFLHPGRLLSGLPHPKLARALTGMHERPGRVWSLEAMAHLAGMSRSAFAAEFKATLGTTPADYLLRWRVVRTGAGRIIARADVFRSMDVVPIMPYIRNMPNISKKLLPLSSTRFIEDTARLLIPWGVPQTAARLYGYLLLCTEPASLDRITDDLQISKSSASVAARLLETYRLVRRHGERGSKRALYAVSDNYEGMLIEQNRLLDALADLLKSGTRVVASKAVQARLDEMAEFHLAIRQAMETALKRWHARKPRA